MHAEKYLMRLNLMTWESKPTWYMCVFVNRDKCHVSYQNEQSVH